MPSQPVVISGWKQVGCKLNRDQEQGKMSSEVSNLMLYTQWTSMVISGQMLEGGDKK